MRIVQLSGIENGQKCVQASDSAVLTIQEVNRAGLGRVGFAG